ncbi:MAG: amidohydrolase family protein [Planctomycetales bacterium]|nr:amidohydrolase family protein [Planctomycetales bacterium]
MESLRIQARMILATPERILCPGQVVIQHGKIRDCLARDFEKPDFDLGDAVIVPGLVNPHSHLEFSDLDAPLPPGRTFPEWISAVVRYRLARQLATEGQGAIGGAGQAAVKRGLTELASNGTALVGEIATHPWEPSWLTASDYRNSRFSAGYFSRWAQHLPDFCALPSVVAQAEVLGLDANKLAETMEWSQRVLTEFDQERDVGCLVRSIGISPHAPYSINWDLAEAQVRKKLVGASVGSMHMAESLEELQWLRSGDGPFAEVFDRLALPVPKNRIPILTLIQWLSSANRGLVIHGNYLCDDEMNELANHPHLSVVYCPRTHAHFQHATYPWQELKRRGIRVVLGTDSRASNPDLNVWDEMVAARQMHPWVSPQVAWGAVTREAAQALGYGHQFGTIEVGKWANLQIIRQLNMSFEWQPTRVLEAVTMTHQSEFTIKSLHKELADLDPSKS